jgi:hypothetical protein
LNLLNLDCTLVLLILSVKSCPSQSILKESMVGSQDEHDHFPSGRAHSGTVTWLLLTEQVGST